MNKRIGVIIVGLAACLMVLAGCKNKEDENIYYRVGKSQISKDDVTRIWMSLPDEMKMQYMSKAGRQELLNSLVSLELLYQEALRQKLDQDTMTKFKIERLGKNLLAQAVVERALNMEDMLLYFQENYAHLDALQFQTREQAQTVYAQLSQGADFDILKSRLDPKRKDRDMGYLNRDDLIERYGSDVSSAVFGLGKDRKFTEPVKTGEGFSIFYAREKPGNLDPQGFESVRNQIVSRKQEEVYRGLVNDLKNRIPVKNNQKNIDQFIQVGTDWEKAREAAPENKPGVIPGTTTPLSGQTAPGPAPSATVSPLPGATLVPLPGATQK